MSPSRSMKLIVNADGPPPLPPISPSPPPPPSLAPSPPPALHPNAFPYEGFVWYTTDKVCEQQGGCSMTCDSVCAHYGLSCKENGQGNYVESPSCGPKNVCVAMFPGASCSADGGK